MIFAFECLEGESPDVPPLLPLRGDDPDLHSVAADVGVVVVDGAAGEAVAEGYLLGKLKVADDH